MAASRGVVPVTLLVAACSAIFMDLNLSAQCCLVWACWALTLHKKVTLAAAPAARLLAGPSSADLIAPTLSGYNIDPYSSGCLVG